MTQMNTIKEMWNVEPTEEAIIAAIESPRFSAPQIHSRKNWKKVILYLNQGRWVADCPFCNSGMPGHPDLEVIGCPDCGGLYKVDLPTKKEREQAEKILMWREKDVHLNWDRQRGETVQTLKEENVTRGFRFT